MWYIRVGWIIILVTFTAMTWAYLVGAHQSGVQISGIVKYPINGLLSQFQPRFDEPDDKHRFRLSEDFPPCNFNTQCLCSNTGPDLGLVFCDHVELGTIPQYLNNTKIHTLTLRNNQLKYLDEGSFFGTGMYRLEIRNNLLFDLPKDSLRGIERSLWQLDLSYNQLSSVPTKSLLKLGKLSYLDLTGNRISDLDTHDFEGLERTLKTLVLAENAIVNLPSGVFQRLQVVQTIDLQGNNIHFLNERSFHGSPSSLVHLNFANNLLKDIPFEALAEVHNLQTLNLAHNRISKTFKVLFTGIISMDTLILDRNEIETLPPYSFQNFVNINRTSLRANPIAEISDDAFKDVKIRELYLHDCNIDLLSENSFKGLETYLHILDLSYNKLSFLPDKLLENLESIRFLSLSNNKLSMDLKTFFNGFKQSLQYLNLIGENMGNFQLSYLKEIRSIRTLGLSALDDSTISKNDFTGFGPAVEKLYLLNNDITSIDAQAFEHVPGIKILDLSFNYISVIDKDAFLNIGSGLENLRISSGLLMSRLPSQPMLYLTNLRELDLSNNELEQIDKDCFRYMRNLQNVNFQDNKITQLYKEHFQGQYNPNLEYIKLSYNTITSIISQTFQDYKKLHSIYLNDNLISNVERFAFLNLENLQYLYLQGNNIKYLSSESFQNLPKLRYLDISFNEMTNLNLDAFEQVGTLSTLTIDAGYNKISYLRLNGTMWNSYSSIKMLIFSNNNISTISPNYFESIRSSIVHMWFDRNFMKNISEQIFENMPHLRLLNFANNFIETVTPNAFRGSYSLQYVNLTNNRIADLPMSVFEDQKDLRHVDLSFNHFSKIPGDLFKDSPLEILRANNNKIKKFPDFAVHKSSDTLRILELAHNEISDLKPTVLNRFLNLVSLDISHNLIKTIQPRAFANIKKLVSLDISHNAFTKIEKSIFDGIEESLQDLNLSNTSLKNFPELKFKTLRQFNVSSNRISFLPSYTLSNYSSLRVLDLSHNEIPSASSSAWQNLPRLRWLFLQDNLMTHLNNDSFLGLQRLEKLDVRQLPLQTFQIGALSPMENLKEVQVTAQPKVQNFNIGKALSLSPSLQKLVLEVEGNLDSQLHGSPLPYKLSNITFMGRRFSSLSNNALQGLRARELRLTFLQTNLKLVSSDFFRNLGQVRYVALAAFNNSMETLGSPSSTSYPGVPGSVFLTDFRVDGSNWKCDCSIGWIESWMKSWRATACLEKSVASCEGTLRSLRKAQCSDRRDKSIMESLKKDLECGSSSGVANHPLGLTTLLTSSILYFITTNALTAFSLRMA